MDPVILELRAVIDAHGRRLTALEMARDPGANVDGACAAYTSAGTITLTIGWTGG